MVERVPLAPLPQEPWWGNPWAVIVTGIVGLLIGGLLGYALGGKGESTRTQGAGEPAITRTVTNTTTVERPKVVVKTNTVTAKTITQTPAPINSANEERRTEAESKLRKLERENEELRRHAEEG